MNADRQRPQLLLLTPDDSADAQWVSELAGAAERDNYDVLHVPLMAAAAQALRSHPVDVVVLDLRLPDCQGVDTVKAVRRIASEVPIVVLTSAEDDQLALDCMDAGAQDCLSKTELRAQSLRRAIGYAITRIRDAQVRELQDSLAHYRALSSSTLGTSVTATMAGSGAVAQRRPELFGHLVRSYYALLEPYLVHITDRVVAAPSALEVLITSLGDAGGGPRDLLDVHVAALDQALAVHADAQARPIVYESRLLALQMMGLLVDYYRVGHRRRYLEESTP